MSARAGSAAALGAAALAAPATALPPDLGGDEFDRAALLALPSVHRLETAVTVEALVTSDGRRIALPEDARRVGQVGTAVVVAPGARLVAAGHVARPHGEALAVAARIQERATRGLPHSREVADAWVERTGARAVGVRVVSRRLTPARVPGTAPGRSLTPRIVRLDERRDLAVLAADLPGAPGLRLSDAATIGTPIVVIGFGGGGGPRAAGEPAVRRGRLGRTGFVREDRERRVVQVTAPVQVGDSGGPTVDAAGRLRGVVVFRAAEGGLIEPSPAIRALLEAAGVRPREGRSARRFRAGLDRLRRLDVEGARDELLAARAAAPGHALAARLVDRADELDGAPRAIVNPGRRRRLLLAVGAGAALLALLCAAGLAAIRRPPPTPPPPGDADAGGSA